MAAPTIATAIGKVQTFILTFATLDAATANVGRFRLPQKARILRIGATARAKSAGLAAFSLMVEAGGTNILAAALDMAAAAAGDFVEGTLTAGALADALAKETEITVDVDAHTAGGETASDVTIQIDYLPED
jgi:hypothetical protein